MNFQYLNFRVYKKYKNTINRENYKGFMLGGGLFLLCLSIDLFARFIISPREFPWYYIVFEVIYAFLIATTAIFKDFVKEHSYISAIVWLFVGGLFLLSAAYVYRIKYVFALYAILSLAYSLYLILNPLYHVISQVFFCVLLSIISYYTEEVMDPGMWMRNILTAFVVMVVGISASNVRLENLLYKNELVRIAGGSLEYFDSDSDEAWETGRRVSMFGGKAENTRKYFSFAMDIDDGKIIHVRKNNILGLYTDMSYTLAIGEIAERIEGEGQRARFKRFFSKDNLRKAYKEKVENMSILFPFNAHDGELYWIVMDISLLRDPMSGNLNCAVMCEDYTNDRMLTDILSALIKEPYESAYVFDPANGNSVQFMANSDGIVQKFNDSYEETRLAYIRNNLARYDIERAMELSSYENISEHLMSDGYFQYTVDEIAENGSVLKKLFKHSYLNELKNRILITKQDITDVINKDNAARLKIEKALIEKETAMKAKEDFLTRMSHEMRTPMNAILGLSALMKDELNNPKALSGYLEKIKYSGDFLLQLINDMLDISKMAANQIELVKEPFVMDQLWETVNMMIVPLAKNKGVDLSMENSIPSDLVILTDKLRFNQIMINLLNNSIKYTPEGGSVVFKCREIERKDGNVLLEFIIKDNGVGMSEEFMQHMFEPFTQEVSTVEATLAGTGLGLSIVKGLMDAFNGDIKIKSKKGKGSEFNLKIPFEIGEARKSVERKSEEIDLSGIKALLVEDNDINRMIATELLEKKDIFVTTANNGVEAIEYFNNSEEGYFDVILMDIRMPVMNGLKATRAIRSMDRADAKTVPIIAMTANAFESDIQASWEAGLDYHLSKPIDPHKLYEVIDEFVCGSREK